jgi:hypothetical protein
MTGTAFAESSLSDKSLGIKVGKRIDAHCVSLSQNGMPQDIDNGMRCFYDRKMTLPQAYQRFRVIAHKLDPSYEWYRKSIKPGIQAIDRFYYPNEKSEEIKLYNGKIPAPKNIWIFRTVIYTWYQGELMVSLDEDDYREVASFKHTAHATVLEYWRQTLFRD